MIKTTVRKQIRELLRLSRRRDIHDYQRLAKLIDDLYVSNAHDENWTKRKECELTAVLTEYNALRQESLETIKNRIQILILGIGVIGAQIVGALSIDDPAGNKLLVISLFSFSIPVTGAYILLLWVSEAIRSHRIGYYLASECEARVNRLLGSLALLWEASLWTGMLPRDEFGGPSMIAMSLIGIISGISPLIGLYLARPAWSIKVVMALALPWLVLALALYYTYRLKHRLRNKPIIQAPSCHAKV